MSICSRPSRRLIACTNGATLLGTSSSAKGSRSLKERRLTLLRISSSGARERLMAIKRLAESKTMQIIPGMGTARRMRSASCSRAISVSATWTVNTVLVPLCGNRKVAILTGCRWRVPLLNCAALNVVICGGAGKLVSPAIKRPVLDVT